MPWYQILKGTITNHDASGAKVTYSKGDKIELSEEAASKKTFKGRLERTDPPTLSTNLAPQPPVVPGTLAAPPNLTEEQRDEEKARDRTPVRPQGRR